MRWGNSSVSGWAKRTPVSTMRRLARTSRWLIVAGLTTNAAAICSAERPMTAWSMSGVRTLTSIAGCAHTKSSVSRSSAESCSSSDESKRDRRCSCSMLASGRARSRRDLRCASAKLLRAAVSSHASGFWGTPSRGHATSASASAPLSASSAEATSRARTARMATSLPYAILAARSAASRAGPACSCMVVHICRRGRTSTQPWGAGTRAAHARAASRSGTSIT